MPPVQNQEDELQPFPEDVFDWGKELTSTHLLSWTLGDFDEHVRQYPEDQVVAYCSLLVIKMNVSKLFQRGELLRGRCGNCEAPCKTNSFKQKCAHCTMQLGAKDLELNPHIFGYLGDETGSIQGLQMLFSDKAWCSVFGRTPDEVVAMDLETCDYFDARCLFMRMTFALGWDPAVGRMAVWDILAG